MDVIMSCVVRWWDVLFMKGMHFSSKNARLLNLLFNYCHGEERTAGVAVAKLVEWLLPTLDVWVSNSVFGNFYLLSNVLKTRKQIQRGREWPI